MTEEASGQVKAAISKLLEGTVLPEDISEKQSLYSPPIKIDSIQLLQLIVELEAAFGCQIDDEVMMETRLENVGDIINLIERFRPQSG